MAWILAIIACPCLVHAQTTTGSKPRPAINHSVHPGEISTLVPGQWGTVGVDVVNPRDQAVDALSTIYFENQPSLQFGRQVWVPPRSRLLTSFPVYTPENLPRSKTSIDIRTLLLDRTAAKEVLRKDSTGEMLGDASLPVTTERPVLGVISDGDDILPNEVVVSMRLIRNLTRRMVRFNGDFLPADLENLQELNHLVIASNLYAKETAGVTAIREWVHNGGQLWLMLDQLEPETVNALLGDNFTYHPVDRVGLTKFSLTTNKTGQIGPAGRVQEFKEPVDFVRVLTSQGSVLHTIDGWPASISLPVGRGHVLFTTVGPNAWIRPRGPKDPQIKDVWKDSKYLANEFLTELAYDFMGQPTEPPALKPADFQGFVAEQIGYRIVSHGMVLLVLGTFCALLVAIGSLLAYQQKLPHLGWLGPLLAVGSATALVVLGSWSRGAVPATVATGQLAEVSEDADDLQLTGLLALYQQTESTAPLGAKQGGVFVPDASKQDIKTRRMVWTDLIAWHWENLALPAGLRTAPFSYSTRLPKPISARATFGPQGLVGKVEADPFQDLADALIVLPGQPIMSAQLGTGGQFTAGPGDILASGEYIGGTILSDERRRRRAVYKKLLEPPVVQDDSSLDDQSLRLHKEPVRNYPTQPLFLTWAAPYDMQFMLPPETQRVGSAVMAIPLKFDHPAKGTTFVVPSSCVTYESVGNSGAYLNREKRWIPSLNKASRTTLRFKLPREVVPMKLQQARLTITIDAPGRTLTITPGTDATQAPLATRTSPVGTVQINIDRADIVKVESDGSFVMSVDVGAAQGETRNLVKAVAPTDIIFPVWKIEKVQLEVTGIAE